MDIDDDDNDDDDDDNDNDNDDDDDDDDDDKIITSTIPERKSEICRSPDKSVDMSDNAQ